MSDAESFIGPSPASRLPQEFLEWLVSSRRQLLGELKQGRQVRFFPAHLPVISTWKTESGWPVNLAVKGIGLLPREELMERYTCDFEKVFDRALEWEWRTSLSLRIESLGRLYADSGHFDPSLLGGLEIFEGRTLGNLRSNPRASLLFMGMLPRPGRVDYISFQINGAVEILSPSHPAYRFLLAARRLFEYDRFHLPQNRYPLGYLVRVAEVIDKSPFMRAEG